MTLRTLLILINIAAVVVIVVVIGAKVLSVRREPTERDPANLTPFYDDDVLEDTHLTKVLRWALVFSTIVAVVLPLYWLLEPSRQSEEAKGFDERAIERGAVLYANETMDAFDSAKSLGCANCHGADGSGGAKDSCSRPRRRATRPRLRSRRNWVAPSLNDILYRFTEDPREGRTRAEIRPDHHLRPARAPRCRRGASPAVVPRTCRPSATSSPTSRASRSPPRRRAA